jgi:DNA invertase Pin-like site-specific DNA recombinase
MRLAAYLRVSTAQQAEEDRFGVPRQRHDVEQFIARSKGEHEMVGEYVEIASGTNGIAGRTAFPEMLTALRDGDIDGVVISDMTRLSRLLTTQEALLASVWASGGRIFTSDGAEVAQDDPDDPMRTAMRQMAGVFAQLERSMISKRLRDGRKAKARVTPGYAWTFAPAGYAKVDGALVAQQNAPIWQAQQRALALREQGLSLRAVAKVLTDERVATATNRATWSAIQVSRLLTK